MNTDKNKNKAWLCGKCQQAMILEKTTVKYLGGHFEVDLLKCPQCKMVLIDEALARGKMLEVEQNLEDK